MSRTRSPRFALLACGLFAGCVSATRGTRLYPASEPLPRERFATLEGYVESVDGHDVAQLEQPLELLPGCHVVVTPNHWGEGSPYGATVATTPHVAYAMTMRPGRRYLIELVPDPRLGVATSGRAQLEARELAGNGEPSRELAAVQSPDELARCRPTPSD